jgi:hypothetical protein
MPHHIFLSYQSASRAKVDVVRNALERQGFTCWHDHRRLQEGDDWNEVIEAALRSSAMVILFLTERCETSDPVKHELMSAEGAGIPIVPVRLEEYRPKSRPLDALERWHYVDAFEKKEAGNGQPPTEPMPQQDMAQYTDRIVTAVRKRFSEREGQLPDGFSGSPVADIGQLVYQTWIAGFLKPTLEGIALKEDHSEGINRPFSYSDSKGTVVQPHAELAELITYLRRSLGKLLISGERGSGKTILMLQLVQSLLPVAENPNDTTTPIVFNVGTWVNPLKRPDRQPRLLDWVEDRLIREFHLHRLKAAELVEKQRVVYCFDGLDELCDRLPRKMEVQVARQDIGDPEFRRGLLNEFLTQIGAMIQQNPRVDVILVGGSTVEEAIRRQGLPFCAAKIIPWQDAEFLEYLNRRGMLRLVEFLRSYPEVKGRLMNSLSELQIMASVFANEAEADGLEGVAREQDFERLFDNVYSHDLKNKYDRYERKPRNERFGHGPGIPVPLSELWTNAPSLAAYLGQPGQGDLFSLDALQPYEVGSDLQARYRAVYGLLVGTGVFLTAGIPSCLSVAADWLLDGSGAVRAIEFSLITLIGFAFVSLLVGAGFWRTRSAILGLVVAVAFSLGRALDSGLSANSPGYHSGWDAGWHQGLFTALGAIPVFCAMFSQFRDDPLDIVPIERWDPDTSKIGYWLLGATGVGVLFWFTGLGWYRGVIFGVVLSVVFMLRFGRKPAPAPIRIRPNQAILFSRDNSISHMLVITLVASLTTGLAYGIAISPREGILDAVMALSASFVVFFFGGLPVAKHLALRLTLVQAGLMPRRLDRWLEVAAGVGLLHQVGGGFGFASEDARSHYAEKLSEKLSGYRWGLNQSEPNRL